MGSRTTTSFYFDASDLSWEAEDAAIQDSRALLADVTERLEVRNEARVHLWYEARFGVPAQPFTSATDAIDAFASTTCCVGITRTGSGLEMYAPHGLEDVFALRLRPNRRLAPRSIYEQKVFEYRQRWPALASDPWSPPRPGG